MYDKHATAYDNYQEIFGTGKRKLTLRQTKLE
jgi:hypothetical protein